MIGNYSLFQLRTWKLTWILVWKAFVDSDSCQKSKDNCGQFWWIWRCPNKFVFYRLITSLKIGWWFHPFMFLKRPFETGDVVSFSTFSPYSKMLGSGNMQEVINLVPKRIQKNNDNFGRFDRQDFPLVFERHRLFFWIGPPCLFWKIMFRG